MEQAGTPVHFEPCDLTDIPALQRTIGAVRSRLGPIQILVNNAANDDRHATDAVTEAVWDGGIAVKGSSTYQLPNGGCATGSGNVLAVIGLLGGALFMLRRRRH